MKIGVSCRREHRFQGSRGSENNEISGLKSEEVKSELQGATFVDFCTKNEPNMDYNFARNRYNFRPNSPKVAKGVQSPPHGLKKVPPGTKVESKFIDLGMDFR